MAVVAGQVSPPYRVSRTDSADAFAPALSEKSVAEDFSFAASIPPISLTGSASPLSADARNAKFRRAPRTG